MYKIKVLQIAQDDLKSIVYCTEGVIIQIFSGEKPDSSHP